VQPDAPEARLEVPEAFADEVLKVKSLRPSQSYIADVLPDEFAVEVDTTVRDENGEVVRPGEKRIDYEGVPIKNADGSLNKYGKAIIEMHEPAGHAGVDIDAKLKSGDFDDKQQTVEERERKHPVTREMVARIAENQKLRPVPTRGPRFRGRSVTDEAGLQNLWLNEAGRLVRIALVGTTRSKRVELYSV
jgi:hypothetical protein